MPTSISKELTSARTEPASAALAAAISRSDAARRLSRVFFIVTSPSARCVTYDARHRKRVTVFSWTP